ncbi:hypothetical protein BFP77_08685 [Maribacter sp. 4U21]|uniref:O-antigen ligase family protein n=1 Tax=Maribacter sp. 4U21 TaxID=1889779 RepID=UPI000C148CDE|nr:O-antigen ligase family protein [Maribacter sp. 4U21]PIB28702.1 hypothetical protein BFP77_08685 [Maribacter sp. 4U21]
MNIHDTINSLKQKNLVLKDFHFNEFFFGISLFFLPISIKVNSWCLIIFFIYNLYNRIKEKSLFCLKFFLFPIIIFIIQLVSFFLSTNHIEASKKLLLFMVFPLLSFFFPKRDVRIEKVFRYLMFGVIIVLVYAFLRSTYDIVFLNERFDYGRGPEILLKYTPHHAYLSLFIIVSIVVLMYQIGKNQISFTNIYIIPFLFISLFLLPSRTALLIAFIIIPLCSFSFFKDRYKYKHIVLFLALLFVLSVVGLSVDFTRDKLLYAYYELRNIPTTEKPFYGISTRQKIWETGLNLVHKTPFFGYGIGDIGEVLNMEYVKRGYDDITDLNAHNQYLQNILQYGLLFSSIIVWIIFEVIRKLISHKDWFLVWIWIITILFFGTESMLNRQWGAVYFAILLILSCYKINLKIIKRFLNSKFE